MRNALRAALLATIMSVGCSDGALTEDAAARLISETDGFKREAHFWIRTGLPLQSTFRCQSEAEVEQVPLNRFVVERGWVRYETREAIVGLRSKASCPAMALTPAGAEASARWTRRRAESTAGTAWAVPIGQRELVAVTELTGGPDGSTQVEFDWKWTPNETGVALRKSVPKADAFFNQTRKGRASCRPENNQWRCVLGMWMNPADAVGELPS